MNRTRTVVLDTQLNGTELEPAKVGWIPALMTMLHEKN